MGELIVYKHKRLGFQILLTVYGSFTGLYEILPFRHRFPLDPLVPVNIDLSIYTQNNTLPSLLGFFFCIHINAHNETYRFSHWAH